MVARDAHLRRIVLETYSVAVAGKLRSEGKDRSVYSLLVNDLKALLQSLEESSVHTVRRSANDAAHRMAKEACENNLCRVWYAIPPDCIANRIVLDSCVS
jgi:hypothetical protein